MAAIRIGKVSKIDYKTGRIAVTYPDMDESVTDLLPFLTFGNEYLMPKVEDYVAVMHLSNGEEMGVVLGTYWDDQHKPPINGKDKFRKDFSNTPGKAYASHDAGTFTLKADNIVFKTSAGTISVAEIIAIVQEVRSWL